MQLQLPPMSSSSATFPPVEPQFATVTFVGEDNALGSTFRVPLNSTTTVNRLAKDAMKRLVLSRLGEGKSHRPFPSLAVTEVYVQSSETQPRAEVFAQDIVNQVVLVKEEVVYMKLRTDGLISVAPSRLPTPPPERLAATNIESAVPADLLKQQQYQQPQTRPDEHAGVTAEPARKSEEQTKVRFKTAAPAKSVSAKQQVTNTTTAPRDAPPKRPGWGPEAYSNFADNYVSTPGKRPRNAAKSAETKKAKAESASSAAAAATDEEREKHAEMERGLRWGPEAARSFPDNYVSSPGKSSRAKKQAAKGSAASAAAPVAPQPQQLPQTTPEAPVSRELAYPDDAVENARTTVGHVVPEPAVVDVEEESTAVDLPKGWGADSLRYFDPNTYCDDPKKARWLPNMDLSRSTRPRRSTTL